MKTFYWIILLLLLTNACKLPAAYGDLRITVKDLTVMPIKNAVVTLYQNLEDYNKQQNPISTEQLTDTNGIVRFNGLSTAGKYYIDVQKDEANNWEGANSIDLTVTENGFNNTLEIVIYQNETGKLANASGKKWQSTSIKLNGSEILDQLDACISDNQIIFFKGGTYHLEEGNLKCNTSDPQRIEGTWAFANDTHLQITLNGTSELWEIINISVNSFRVLQNISFEGQNETVEVIYELM